MTTMDLTGVAAPPRSNGELLFEEPWHSRAFAMAVALNEAGVFTWPQFQEALIARIARWEAADRTDWHYYHHWLGALEDVLGASGVISVDDVRKRADGLARRPAGHDHAH